MHIRYGYSIAIACDAPVTVVTMLDVHPECRHGIVDEEAMAVSGLTRNAPVRRIGSHADGQGNIVRRLVAPAGGIRIAGRGVMRDTGRPDEVSPGEPLVSPEALPPEALPYLLASRYCESDLLGAVAWSGFGGIAGGWARVQAVCDYVHDHLRFDYGAARQTRTAMEAWQERVGVGRDHAHLAIALCRALNVPARYCSGYLGEIGVPPSPHPTDFGAWFEAFLGGRWWTFDARHNRPRVGRIVVGRGRDAGDVAILNTFGVHRLVEFEVTTEEIVAPHRKPRLVEAAPAMACQGHSGQPARKPGGALLAV